MKLSDMPIWVQTLYWYWHGPVGNVQPRAKGYSEMSSTSGVITFLAQEAVLFIVLMLALWGVRSFFTSEEAKKWVSLLLIVVIGAAMLLRLLAFAGIA